MTKREFLSAGIGAGMSLAHGRAAFAQSARQKVPTRMAKTKKLFRSPEGFPNGLAATPEGLWIGEQKLSGAQAASYKLKEPKSLDEAAWLALAPANNTFADPGIPGCADATALALAPGDMLDGAAPPDDGFFDTNAAFRGAFRDARDTWAPGAWVRWADD